MTSFLHLSSFIHLSTHFDRFRPVFVLISGIFSVILIGSNSVEVLFTSFQHILGQITNTTTLIKHNYQEFTVGTLCKLSQFDYLGA